MYCCLKNEARPPKGCFFPIRKAFQASLFEFWAWVMRVFYGLFAEY